GGASPNGKPRNVAQETAQRGRGTATEEGDKELAPQDTSGAPEPAPAARPSDAPASQEVRVSAHPTRPAPSLDAESAKAAGAVPKLPPPVAPEKGAEEPPTKIRGLSIIALAGSTTPTTPATETPQPRRASPPRKPVAAPLADSTDPTPSSGAWHVVNE